MLIQVKGEKRVHVRRCETTAASLNYSDVFILDAGDKIYQWNGPHSHRNKRTKGKSRILALTHYNNNYLYTGVDVANAINRKQRSGGADLIIIEALQKGDDDGAPKEFWAILGGKPATIPETGGDDAQTEKMWNELDKLYR